MFEKFVASVGLVCLESSLKSEARASLMLVQLNCSLVKWCPRNFRTKKLAISESAMNMKYHPKEATKSGRLRTFAPSISSPAVAPLLLPPVTYNSS